MKTSLHPTVSGADDDNGPPIDNEPELAGDPKVDLGRLLDPNDDEGGSGGAGRKRRRPLDAQELLRLANARIRDRCRRHGLAAPRSAGSPTPVSRRRREPGLPCPQG